MNLIIVIRKLHLEKKPITEWLDIANMDVNIIQIELI